MDCLYIITPAYNEELNIESFVKQWYPIVESYGDTRSRLVIINDGSKDNTLHILRSLESNYPKLIVLDKLNEGHGPTLIYGYRYAIEQNADFVFQTDSDGQTNPSEFDEFWALRYEYDGLFGNRKVRGDGLMRKLVEKVLVSILFIVFGVKLPDANAPFRLFKVNVLKKYIERFPVDFNLPNVMLTVYFSYFEERMKFIEISFKPRIKGENSINIKKIVTIGLNAIRDFYKLRREL